MRLSAKGAFGQVIVTDYEGTRLLAINTQVQGQAHLQPPGPEGIVPGPVAVSPYMNGWLLAGSLNPDAHGLMMGLGSGCGAVALLNSCPGITLTVVEIDPVIVTLAQQGFPLLGYYQDQGRLQIVTADATDFVQTTQDHWDLGFLDAYTGENIGHAPDELVYGMLTHCEHLWVNCIDALGGPAAASLTELCAAVEKPIVFTCGVRPGAGRQNLILATQAVADHGFTPYPDCDPESPVTQAARTAYAQFVTMAVASVSN